MPAYVRIAGSVLLLCAMSIAVVGCGASPSGGSSASAALTLHVTLTNSPLDRYVSDSAAAQRLYTAAMALHLVPPGEIFHCPADDGRVYHLSFLGGTVAQRQMTANASGCPFLFVGQENRARYMDAAFIALFTHTLGVPSLDPYFPNG